MRKSTSSLTCRRGKREKENSDSCNRAPKRGEGERRGSSAIPGRRERGRKVTERGKRRKCEKCVMLVVEEGRMRANGQRNEGPERNRGREGGRKRRRKEQE